MGYFAGLDVSLEETAICIVDDGGLIVREARVASVAGGVNPDKAGASLLRM